MKVVGDRYIEVTAEVRYSIFLNTIGSTWKKSPRALA